MLWKAFIVCAIFILKENCDGTIPNGQLSDSYEHAWNWDSRDLFPEESRSLARDVELVTEKDREPLSPEYKEPSKPTSGETPVLKPKPQNPSFNPSILPGGVIDIAAGSFSPFENPFQSGQNSRPGFPFTDVFSNEDEFGFPSLNQRPGGLFGGIFSSVGELKPWWKGNNVCIEREESTDDADEEEVESKKNQTEIETDQIPNLFATSISLSNCQQTPNKYECVTKINNHGVVKTFTVRYKCCYGYARSKGASGCDKQIDLKSLLETIDDLGAKEFKSLIQSNGLEETFNNENLTVFAPSDVALNDFNEKMSRLNDLSVAAVRRRRALSNPIPARDLVLNQATKGFVDLTELINEEIIYSENNNSTIRINNYPTQNYERLVTANCARVTKAENLAKNGIVHLIDGVIAPATQTVQEIIKDNKRLSNLQQVFENTDLFKKFRDEGHYTVFAPTDEAFAKLDDSVKTKLLNGDACAKSILKHHVTPHTVCSAAIIGNSTTHNVEGAVLNMERTIDDQLIFEGKAKITETDIIATNGVIHLIDTIIIPEAALHINEALKKEDLTKFQELIEKAGLVDQINDLNNVTLFAPSNEAFKDSKAVELLEEIGDDKNKLAEFIAYHTIQGQLPSCEMNNNALLTTRDNGKKLRLNLYSTLPLFNNVLNRATLNCARITGFDEKSCGSVIHEVNKFLVPPTHNIFELIQNDSKYSKLRKIIEGTKVEEILKQNNRSITLLAPTDETFAAIDDAELKVLEEDKEKANEVLKNHILTEVLCCSGVGPHSWGFNSLVPTLSHQSHQISRTGGHQIRIGRAVVTSCDNVATNGVVQSINKVLFPRRQIPANVGGFFLLDF